MKLELKHLAPYLPYGLKYIDWDYEEFSLDGLDVNGDAFCADSGEVDFQLIKPILRPLSDLEDNEDNTPEELSKCCWSYTQKLISEHYDVFGLIPEGLAVDINKINKNTIL